ncbi:MAG TPA: hypothetical protein VG755_10750 [Nannocystaceae bacterium]|nr:hypothetical protein [Nannocystaceae bacterium]
MRWALAALAIALAPAIARADHVPGHGASDAVRTLNSFGGGTGAATSRVMLLQEASRATRTLSPNSSYSTSLIGEYSPHKWFSFGLQLPLQVVDEDAARAKVGLGNVRVLTRLTLHADKLYHRILTFGINAGFPTRTIRFTVDPGKQWSQAPYVVFTRNYRRPFWQVFASAPIESRPAGTAIDLAAAAQGGYRFLGVLTPSAGLLTTVRVASWCRAPTGDASFCRGGRVTELDRPIGSTAVYVTFGLSWAFKPWGLLAAGAQIPVTPKRDFDAAGTLSFQATF